MTGKDLISKIYSSYNSINKEKKRLTQKWAEDLNRHFSKEDYIWPKSKCKDAQHQKLLMKKIKSRMRNFFRLSKCVPSDGATDAAQSSL